MHLLLPALLLSCSDYGFNPGKPDNTDDSGVPDGPVDDCADLIDPGSYRLTVDDGCLNEPGVGGFTPVVEWQWQENPLQPGFDDIMATPVIANLTDDDGDGDVDQDDVPDICFTSFAGGAYTSPGALTCISGDGSGTHWSITSAGGHGVQGSGGVAIGDLEGDGWPDVCVASTSNAVLCLERDGSFKWAGGVETSYVGCPSIADLDGDGRAEVLFGREILSSRGALMATGAAGSGYKMSFAVDMDGDGDLEVVAGNTVYQHDGTVLWQAATSDTMAAVGDFELDGLPDVVLGGGGLVTLIGNDGVVRWSVPVNGGGNGGPPTIADFDGDGLPEVGVAGASYYTVYETDGTVLWAQPVSDYSSNVTGSSVFDFEGDGAAEVVYADEHTLWVYDGATGAVELSEAGHASGTLYEYPIVADVDHDGSTEIILASNDYGIDGWNGITVIGDESSTWAPARPVWNQFAYHITNVDNDGGIPAVPVDNWLSWNNFRAGGTELGPSHWLADLRPEEPSRCLDLCAADRVVLYVPVENSGLLGTRDFQVSLVTADGAVAWSETVEGLEAGAGTWLGPIELGESDWGRGELALVVDRADGVAECDEGDNRRALGAWPCE